MGAQVLRSVLPWLLLVCGDGGLEIAVFLAGEKAQFVQYRKVLLSLCQVAGLQIRLSHVLVSPPMLGVERERPLVVLECRVQVAAIALGKTQLIVDRRAPGITRQRFLEQLDGRIPVLGLDLLLRAVEVGIGRCCIHTVAAAADRACLAGQRKHENEKDQKRANICFHRDLPVLLVVEEYSTNSLFDKL